MIRRPPRSTLSSSSAASDVYKRQHITCIYYVRSSKFLLMTKRMWVFQSSSIRLSLRSLTASSNLSLIHISEPTRLLSISYAVFCLKKKKKKSNKAEIEGKT
eukprot:TRINITY_DN19015_c0_g1_i1.p1 TRINITY_DN19015_c0_g1~~TRINITY_DN19015_c0_g1_i1.p1  ORF type:complete len:102 (+),score=24.52 TRINITY_DN19015_c0_g1_i1:153-458(+)